MRRSWVLSFIVIAFIPLRAHAEVPSTNPSDIALDVRHARPPMRELGLGEALGTGILSAGVLAATFMPYPVHETPPWQGGILFDDAIRNALQLRSPQERELASTISDVIVGGLVLTPVFIDALLMSWLVRGDPELMGRMMLMNLQAHAFAQGLTTLFKHVVGRERPMARACREDPERRQSDPTCDSSSDPDIDPASFFSGHASLAFTSAALMCLNHTQLGLFGPEGDAAMCATGVALASTVGLLRILADRHYATDVIIGALVGVIAGGLVPWLLHFNVGEAVGINDMSATVAPMVNQGNIGIQISGFW